MEHLGPEKPGDQGDTGYIAHEKFRAGNGLFLFRTWQALFQVFAVTQTKQDARCSQSQPNTAIP